MDKGEFLNFIKQCQIDAKNARKLKKNFILKMTNALYAHMMTCYPNIETNDEGTSTGLMQLSRKCAESVNETITSVGFEVEDGAPPSKLSAFMPNEKTKEDSQKELDDFLTLLKEVKMDGEATIANVKKEHWEVFEDDNKHIRFLKGVHNIAKEVIVEFYFDDILELNSNSLRMLDENTYIRSVEPYIEEVYELVPDLV